MGSGASSDRANKDMVFVVRTPSPDAAERARAEIDSVRSRRSIDGDEGDRLTPLPRSISQRQPVTAGSRVSLNDTNSRRHNLVIHRSRAKSPIDVQNVQLKNRRDLNGNAVYEFDEHESASQENKVNIYVPYINVEKIDVGNKSPNQIIKERREKAEQQRLKEIEEKENKKSLHMKKMQRIKMLTSHLKAVFTQIKRKYTHVQMHPDIIEEQNKRVNRLHGFIGMRTLGIKRDCTLADQLTSCRNETSWLHTRLDQVVVARLKYENPDIAELSDEISATKLAEEVSELFDDEWRESFEATQRYHKKKNNRDLTDDDITLCLNEILKACYTLCQQIVERQIQVMFFSLNLRPEADFSTCSPGLRLRIKQLQMASSTFGRKHLLQIIKLSISRLDTVSLVIYQREVCYTAPVMHYLDRCIDICWYFLIHDPPLFLDFTESSDHSEYRVYSQTGSRIDFLIWPITRLYDGGPALAKGVAQFTNIYDFDNTKLYYRPDQRRGKTPNKSSRRSTPSSNYR